MAARLAHHQPPGTPSVKLAKMVNQIHVVQGPWGHEPTPGGGVWCSHGCSTPIGPLAEWAVIDMRVETERTVAQRERLVGTLFCWPDAEQRWDQMRVLVARPSVHWASRRQAREAMTRLLHDDLAPGELEVVLVPDQSEHKDAISAFGGAPRGLPSAPRRQSPARPAGSDSM